MAAQTHIREISPDEVRQKIERGEGVCLVDVRTPVEYAQCHIPNILLLPMDKFAHGFRAVLAPDDEIVCICEHGVRSESAARYLAAQGYSTSPPCSAAWLPMPGRLKAACQETQTHADQRRSHC